MLVTHRVKRLTKFLKMYVTGKKRLQVYILLIRINIRVNLEMFVHPRMNIEISGTIKARKKKICDVVTNTAMAKSSQKWQAPTLKKCFHFFFSNRYNAL